MSEQNGRERGGYQTIVAEPPWPVDGTKWVRWRETYLREGLALVSAPPQLELA